ncbi:MAG: head GIN domain-containing protein [Prolixibacteraceae bacterium]
MKTMKIQSLLVLLILMGATLSVHAAKEKTKSELRDVGAFSAIHVSSGIDLYLTQGKSQEVRVEAESDLVGKIITRVENGVLKICIKDKMNWDLGWNQMRKVHVTFVELQELNASAGSDVLSQNPFRMKELKISSSSGSDVEIDDLSAEFVSVVTSSGADAKVSGKTIRMYGDASSGSDLDCSELVAKECEVNASSGSDALVHATTLIKAHASSGGDIRYAGNPAQREVNESSGGDVTRSE